MEQSLSQSLIPILFSKRADESRTMERTIATNVSFHRLMKKKKKKFDRRTKIAPLLLSHKSKTSLHICSFSPLVVKRGKSPRDHVQPRNNYAICVLLSVINDPQHLHLRNDFFFLDLF